MIQKVSVIKLSGREGWNKILENSIFNLAVYNTLWFYVRPIVEISIWKMVLLMFEIYGLAFPSSTDYYY